MCKRDYSFDTPGICKSVVFGFIHSFYDSLLLVSLRTMTLWTRQICFGEVAVAWFCLGALSAFARADFGNQSSVFLQHYGMWSGLTS